VTGLPRNEAAVRKETIAAILKALDYRYRGDNDIRYELARRYPGDLLGRKKSIDSPIRGKADYVCIAGGRGAWALEAKPSGRPITEDDIEQAFTHAQHPEVRGRGLMVSLFTRQPLPYIASRISGETDISSLIALI
jgi:hypothetical protein